MSVLHLILAHAGVAAHAHPHGIDLAGALVAGGIVLVLGFAARAVRRER